jgi:hypothetical protein
MRSHEGEPASPFDVNPDEIADRRRIATGRLELMSDLCAGLSRTTDRPRPPVRGPEDHSPVRRLTPTTRVEHRPVEDEQRRLAALHGEDARLHGVEIRVRVAELLADRRHWRRDRYSAVIVPTMFGWTVQTNA